MKKFKQFAKQSKNLHIPKILEKIWLKFISKCGFCKKIYLDFQFISYVFIGGFSAFVDFVLFVILYSLTHFVYINVLTYLTGTLVSFLLNSSFNFRVFNKWRLRYIKLIFIASFGALWSSVLIKFLVLHGLWAVLSKILVLPFVLVYQYLMAKKFVYNKI